MKTLASIDVGTYTARLLVARVSESSSKIFPLARKRSYIRLGEDFVSSNNNAIKNEAFERTFHTLREFFNTARKYGVEEICAVATGVVRDAVNREEFLTRIFENTGIEVKIVSGREEARLTSQGVMYALELLPGNDLVFDLGGGSTEFFFMEEKSPNLISVPMGALLLTQRYCRSDPPIQDELTAISDHVAMAMSNAFPELFVRYKDFRIIGTGGTVVTLAAMLNLIPVEEIKPEKINGMKLERVQIEKLFNEIKCLTMEERSGLTGLDVSRAAVILGGVSAVIGVMHFFKSQDLNVSMSDLLEGLLIDYLEGVRRYV